MAQITNWLKRLGKPSTRRPVMVKVVSTLSGSSGELWITDEENRVLRCALTLSEVTALAESLRKYLAQAQSPREEEVWPVWNHALHTSKN
jgi:hypothetical protein